MIPKPSPIHPISKINSGRVKAHRFGLTVLPDNQKYNQKTMKTPKRIPNEIKLETMIDMGTLNLGKKTLPKILELATKVLEVEIKQVEK